MKRAFQVTALFLSAVLVACEATPGCPEGQVADGDVCVPEGCGVGTWGDLSVDGDTVYVNLTARRGGTALRTRR